MKMLKASIIISRYITSVTISRYITSLTISIISLSNINGVFNSSLPGIFVGGGGGGGGRGGGRGVLGPIDRKKCDNVLFFLQIILHGVQWFYFIENYIFPQEVL